jgi:hypothetical protein
MFITSMNFFIKNGCYSKGDGLGGYCQKDSSWQIFLKKTWILLTKLYTFNKAEYVESCFKLEYL